MENKPPLDRAIEIIGGPAKVGRLFGISPQAVCKWQRIPAERCIDIERATGGLVTCEELRPDVDWGFLRSTNCPPRESETAVA